MNGHFAVPTAPWFLHILARRFFVALPGDAVQEFLSGWGGQMLPHVYRRLVLARNNPRKVWDALSWWGPAQDIEDGFLQEVVMSGKGKGAIAVKAWANVSLDNEAKAAIVDSPIDAEKMLMEFAKLVCCGYRLSITFDDYSNAIQVSLVCVNDTSPNFQLGLSSRHPDIDTALRSLLYKHFVLTAEKWDDFTTPTAKDQWS
jgi:hypothetical protein